MDKKYMAIGTSMLVLKLLEEGEMYGYMIIRELEERSESVFQLKEGTLYPVLHSLEQQGAVVSEEKTAQNGRVRRYYRLTPSGRGLLKEKEKEWADYQRAVNRVIGGVSFGL